MHTDYIFASTVGTPLDLAAVRRKFQAMLKRLGLPQIRLCDCRHSHATALITEGVPVEFVADRLGHRSPATAVGIAVQTGAREVQRAGVMP